jgi:hypothetical protein
MNKTIISRDEARMAGGMYFFTGEPCRRGHVADRYVATGGCVACNREAVRFARCKTHPPDHAPKVREIGSALRAVIVPGDPANTRARALHVIRVLCMHFDLWGTVYDVASEHRLLRQVNS